jgi:hypothetical protein
MTENKKLALECLWEEAKMYSKLYYETDNEYKKHKYVSHFRSPIYDETNISFFQKEFISLRAFNKEGKITEEHCNGRTNCSKKLLEKIHLKEIVTFDEFVNFLKEYCYTIKILSEENVSVATYLKKHKEKNFIEAYNDLGIIICDQKGTIIEKLDLPII